MSHLDAKSKLYHFLLHISFKNKWFENYLKKPFCLCSPSATHAHTTWFYCSVFFETDQNKMSEMCQNKTLAAEGSERWPFAQIPRKTKEANSSPRQTFI